MAPVNRSFNMTNVHPLEKPSPEEMEAHLNHLFDGFLDGCHDGLIELGWTGKDRALKNARLFETDEIEELIEFAVEINSVPQQNVYIGVALRNPGADRDKRSSDTDFYALTACYCDLDAKGAAEAARGNYRGCEPTAVVITGKEPHYRAHLYWRFETPITDPEIVRTLNSGLAVALNGDPAVVNPSRVMRLAGSIAWPHKKGRVIEKTKFLDFDDGRPPTYPSEQIQTAFPINPPEQKVLDLGSIGINKDECVDAIMRGESLHTNARDLAAKLVGQGFSSEEIKELLTRLLKPVSDGGTLGKIDHFINTARKKYNKAEPEPELPPEPVDLKLIHAMDWQGVKPEKRQWMVDEWVPKHHVTGLYGDGGIGKTLLAQQLLTSIATGKNFLSLKVEQTKCFGFLCEDYANDIHLNQMNINRELGVTFEDLGYLKYSSRVGENNLLMTFDGRDEGKLTPLYNSLVEMLIDQQIEFVVLDTLTDVFGGNENIRTQARQFVANCLGRMAREIGGTVLVCAHPSIAGMQSGMGYGGNTAWSNTFRSRLYLERPNEEEPDPNARVISRKKSNYAGVGQPIELLWSEGVLAPYSTKGDKGGPLNRMTRERGQEILIWIQAAWDSGTPFADTYQSGKRFINPIMRRRYNLKKRECEELLQAWWENGIIEIDVSSHKTKLKGIRVKKWLKDK